MIIYLLKSSFLNWAVSFSLLQILKSNSPISGELDLMN